MKKHLIIMATSIGIALNTGLSFGQTGTSPASITNTGAGLNITLAEQAATVRQIAEEASKGFDAAAHARDLTRRINEILATLPPPPAENTNAAPASVPAKAAPTVQPAPVPTPPTVAPFQGPMSGGGELAAAPPAMPANSLRDAVGELEASVRRLKDKVDQLADQADRLNVR